MGPDSGSGKDHVVEAEGLQQELPRPAGRGHFKDPVSVERGHFCRSGLSPAPSAGSRRRPPHYDPTGPGPAHEEDAARRQGPVTAPPGAAAALPRGGPAARALGVQGVPGAPGPPRGAPPRGLRSCRNKMKNQRLRFSAEFAKLNHFLAEEEQLFLQRLSEEKESKKKWNENTLRLNQIIASLKELILEVWEKNNSSILELLQNPKDLLTRSGNQVVNYSVEVLKVKTVCHIPMMKEMLKRFQVAISLVEDTAHPKLVFSQKGRYVKNGASVSSWPLFSTAWNYFTG